MLLRDSEQRIQNSLYALTMLSTGESETLGLRPTMHFFLWREQEVCWPGKGGGGGEWMEPLFNPTNEKQRTGRANKRYGQPLLMLAPAVRLGGGGTGQRKGLQGSQGQWQLLPGGLAWVSSDLHLPKHRHRVEETHRCWPRSPHKETSSGNLTGPGSSILVLLEPWMLPGLELGGWIPFSA